MLYTGVACKSVGHFIFSSIAMELKMDGQRALNLIDYIFCNGSNCTEVNCSGPNGPGPLCMAQRFNRAELSRVRTKFSKYKLILTVVISGIESILSLNLYDGHPLYRQCRY